MLKKLFLVIVSIFLSLFANAVKAEDYSKKAEKILDTEFQFKYFQGDIKDKSSKPTYIGMGIGGHQSIYDSKALGLYVSGLTQLGASNFGIYGRGEILRDKNNELGTRTWAWKAAVGIGYYLTRGFTPYISLAQCYPTEASCFVIITPDGSTERDTDSIYIGLGGFIAEPIFDNHIEISVDWSPYSIHNNRSIYIGYAFVFE